jgi:hypothetical protein
LNCSAVIQALIRALFIDILCHSTVQDDREAFFTCSGLQVLVQIQAISACGNIQRAFAILFLSSVEIQPPSHKTNHFEHSSKAFAKGLNACSGIFSYHLARAHIHQNAFRA